MKQQKKAFSLIIAMMLVLASTLLAFTILEFMMPFAKNLKGVENAANAYYYANSGIERALYFFKTREDKNITKELQGDGVGDRNISIKADKFGDYTISTTSKGITLPIPGTGDAEDPNYNTISKGNQIQLQVGYGLIKNISKLKISFRVPKKGVSSLGTLKNIETGYIMWSLTGEKGSISAQGQKIDDAGKPVLSEKATLISTNQINNINSIKISDLEGTSYNRAGQEKRDIRISKLFLGKIGVQGIKGFDCKNKSCILSFSVVQELKTNDQKTLPHLEWKMEYGNTAAPLSSASDTIPLRYSRIESNGTYGGFGRNLEVRYPQKTANEALSITVLQ